MSYFKRFADFCAGFALFSAVIYLFRQFMAYTPKEEVSLLEKLKLFFNSGARLDYKEYLPLLLLLLLSFIVSLAFHRLPYVCFAVSVLPLLQLISMYTSDRLYERPMLYVILVGMHSLGCLTECVRRDREDRRRRSALGTDAVALIAIGFCLYVLRLIPKLATMEIVQMSLFERKIFFSLENANTSIFWKLAVIYAAAVLLRWLLRDLYYLDAALAAIPFGYTLYLWHGGRIPFHGSFLVTLAAVYLIARLIVMLSCHPKTACAPVS